MTVRMVCFDWGGVILRHCRSWEEGCAAAGLDLRIDARCEQGIARRRELTRLHQVGKFEHSQYLQALRDAVGGVYAVEELAKLHDAWLLDEYEGVHEVIASLASTPWLETGLLSNTNHAHWVTHLPSDDAPARYPTAGLLKHRHASHLMGLMKPGQEIYREFERLTSCASHEILFFDDLEENVRTARALGWHAVHVDHTGDTASQIKQALKTHGVKTADHRIG